MDASLRKPSPVDAHVGARIRLRRKLLGLSQQQLAERLGLTFQQVQKYEQGTNRVSSSMLYRISGALRVPIVFFFEGLPDPNADPKVASDLGMEQSISAFLMTPEGLELAELFPSIEESSLRRRILELVRELAGHSRTKVAAVG